MDEATWVRVCRDDELTEGEPRVLNAGGQDVYLVRLDGAVRAVGTECPHYHEPLIKGVLLGHEVVCPAHFARLDARDGRMISPPALDDLPRYPVKIENGDVWVGPVEKPRFPKPRGDDPRTFLIVGGGAAGEAAAETLRREGFAGRIVMVTAEDERPYDRPNLSKDLLTGKAKPEWMPLRGPKFHANQNIELITGRRVTAVDPAAKTVTLSTGERIAFDRALIATGGVPKQPLDSRSRRRGVLPPPQLRRWPGPPRGGIRVEERGARRRGVHRHGARRRAARAGAPGPGDLPRTPAAVQGARRPDRGLAPRAPRGKGGRVPSRGDTRPGHRGRPGTCGWSSLTAPRCPEGSWCSVSASTPPWSASRAPASPRPDGIPVDASLRTRHPDIFAAGDVAIAPDIAGEAARVEHWAVALRQGRHAARAMLGAETPYGEAHFFWTRQACLPLKYAGAARSWDEIVYRGDVEAATFLAGFYRAGALKAAATIGRRIELAAVEHLMRAGRTPSRAEFADGGFDLVAAAKTAAPRPSDGRSL